LQVEGIITNRKTTTGFQAKTGAGHVACEDMMIPTITPKRPRALPKISMTKILTNKVEF